MQKQNIVTKLPQKIVYNNVRKFGLLPSNTYAKIHIITSKYIVVGGK